MPRSARAFVPALLALLATPAMAVAQACLGAPSFASNHLQMNAGYTFTSDFDEIGASWVSGSNSVFAGLGVSSFAVEGGDANLRIGGSLGYQVPVTDGGVQACPLLRASVGLPTSDYNGLGGDLTTQSYGFGLAVGGTLLRSGRVALMPSISATVQRDFFKVSGGLAPDEFNDTYVLAGAALGLVLNESLSLRPSVAIPVNASFDDPVFSIGVALNFGGRR